MVEYTDVVKTNAAWIPQIPAHWQLLKIDALFTERKTKVSDKDYAPLSVTKKGILPQLEHAAKSNDSDNRKLVKAGDFVINSRSDRKGSCGVSKLDGSVSLINLVLTPRSELNNDFVHYLLRNYRFSEEYYRNGRGIVADLWTTRYSEMRTILLPVPPRVEQDQIVRFLDWKVSEINKLILINKKQIGLLKEIIDKRVSQVVTRGLDANATLTESGIEWIGKMPAHWKAIRCKYLFKERDQRSEHGEEQHLSMSQKYGLIPDSMLDERRMLSASYKGGKLCYKNDLVLNRLKAHLGVFALAPQLGVISPDYTVLQPNTERIIPAFAEMVLKSQRCRRELRIRVRGIIEGFWRLYTDDFYTIVIPVPPIEEQKQIINYIDEYKTKIDGYIAVMEREIDTLRELRNTIIADTVTGKIDVRNVTIPEYEHIDDISDDDNEDGEGTEEAETDGEED